VLDELIHHVQLTFDVTILTDAVGVVLCRNIACLPRFTISTHLHRAATLAVIPTTSLVNRASLISNVVLMDPLVSVVSITTMTAIVLLLAADQDLWTDVDVRPGSFSHDLDSV